MAIPKEKKHTIVEKLSSAFQGAQSLVFVHFNKVPVKDMTLMRKSLRDAGIVYTVAKKTLIGRALDTVTVSGQRPELAGEIAIAYGDDQLAPAREIGHFAKKFQKNVEIVGGIFDGTYMDKAAMTEIALIPPRDTLLAQFVYAIRSPIQKCAIALSAIAEKQH